MIEQEISEADYRIAESVTAFMTTGEYGPFECGCCVVATEFDPVGPRLVFVMRRKDAAEHKHSTLADLFEVLP